MSYKEKKQELMSCWENGFLLIALFVMQGVLFVAKLIGAGISWWMVLMPLFVCVVAFVLYCLWLMVAVIWIAYHNDPDDDH